jgi:hypothetical protein
LELYEDFFWVTGQPTVDQNGKPNINVTDPYPYVWKINVKKNAPVLKAYIENFFLSYQKHNFIGMTAGDIYNQNVLKPKYNLFDDLNQLNRWIHPFPLNKFYMWFPGIKLNNNCDLVNLPDGLSFYQPVIYYNLENTGNTYTLALAQWKEYDPLAYTKEQALKHSKIDGRISVTIGITTILLILIISVYFYIKTKL